MATSLLVGAQISQDAVNTYFMISLCDRFPNSLHDALEFPHGPHDATLDQLEFRADGRTQLLQRSVIRVDVPDCVRGLREFPEEVILRGDRMEEDGEMLRKAASGREECWQRDRSERLRERGYDDATYC